MGRGVVENDAGWTTLSESTMGTILRLVGRHLPLTTTRHLQKLTRTSGQEVAVATEHSRQISGFFEKTASMNDTSPFDWSSSRNMILSISYLYLYLTSIWIYIYIYI